MGIGYESTTEHKKQPTTAEAPSLPKEITSPEQLFELLNAISFYSQQKESGHLHYHSSFEIEGPDNLLPESEYIERRHSYGKAKLSQEELLKFIELIKSSKLTAIRGGEYSKTPKNKTKANTKLDDDYSFLDDTPTTEAIHIDAMFELEADRQFTTHDGDKVRYSNKLSLMINFSKKAGDHYYQDSQPVVGVSIVAFPHHGCQEIDSPKLWGYEIDQLVTKIMGDIKDTVLGMTEQSSEEAEIGAQTYILNHLQDYLCLDSETKFTIFQAMQNHYLTEFVKYDHLSKISSHLKKFHNKSEPIDKSLLFSLPNNLRYEASKFETLEEIDQETSTYRNQLYALHRLIENYGYQILGLNRLAVLSEITKKIEINGGAVFYRINDILALVDKDVEQLLGNDSLEAYNPQRGTLVLTTGIGEQSTQGKSENQGYFNLDYRDYAPAPKPSYESFIKPGNTNKDDRKVIDALSLSLREKYPTLIITNDVNIDGTPHYLTQTMEVLFDKKSLLLEAKTKGLTLEDFVKILCEDIRIFIQSQAT